MRSFEELSRQFEYDQTLPLKLEESQQEQRENSAIRDISYASLAQENQRVKAYLVSPLKLSDQSAGILFVHPGPGNRSNFLEDALQLAGPGVVSLLVEMPWSQGAEWFETMKQPADYRRAYTQVVLDLRRAVDLLSQLEEVDADRLGYVGHSFGGLFGGVLCGVEKRLQAFVLMAAVGSFTDVAQLNMPDLKGEVLAQLSQAFAPLDPVHYVSQAAPSPLFFQFGLGDNFFAREKFEEYARTGSQPKLVKWYEADHYGVNEAGRTDRREWLSEQLAFQI